jgi:hypothetical protein
MTLAEWFQTHAGEAISIGLSTGFAVEGQCHGVNADGSAVFLTPKRSGRKHLYVMAHIVTAGCETDCLQCARADRS